MGASTSIVKLESLTKEDIAKYIKTLPKLDQYADIFLENDIDGPTLLATRDSDLPDVLSELGIKSAIHRSKLTAELMKIKTSALPNSASTPSVELLVDDKFETSFMVFGDDKDFKGKDKES